MIYLLDQNSSVHPMTESKYDQEADLQELIMRNPNLVLRDPNENGANLFMVSREYAIDESADGSNTFSLDLLLLDQSGTPVLVEVKRSTDTRIKREVVAQMLDYASRVSAWDVDRIRTGFESCNRDLASVEPYSTAEFWNHVAACLKAERIKLVFAADEIPRSLKTLIEFMDRSMDGIEVYGVEIRRYISNGATMLSSTVVGETPVTPTSSTSHSSTVWSEASMNDYLAEREEDYAIPVIRAIEKAASSLGIEYAFSQHTKMPGIYFRAGDMRLFYLCCWSKAGKDICTAEFWIKNLLSLPGMNLNEKELRDLIGGIPKRTEAEKAGLLWNTPNYLHIEMQALTDSENLQRFICTMKALYEMLL